MPVKIGSIGWCMVGSWSIKLAVDQPKLAACIVNYGWLPRDPALVAKIKAPMQELRRKRSGIPAKDVKAFEAAMKGRRKVADIKNL